jgi:hypothetical protein
MAQEHIQKAYLHYGSHGGPMQTVETRARYGSGKIRVGVPDGWRILQVDAHGADHILYHGEVVAVQIMEELSA